MINPFVLVSVAALAYMMAMDDNVTLFLVLQAKRLGLNVQRAIWIARYHPETPWAKYEMDRRAWRIAEELQKSFSLPQEDRK